MLSKTDNQPNFFDEYVYGRLIPKEHILVQIREKIDFSFVEEETRDLYRIDFGRPAYPAEVMFRILFLEYYYNHSDVDIAQRCKHDILYRYFVGLRIEDATPDDTSLVVFRKRLGAERFERIFDVLVKRCQEAGLLKERMKVIDASKVIADTGIVSLVNLMRHGRRKILRGLQKQNGKRFREIIKAGYYTKKKEYKDVGAEELKREVEISKAFISEMGPEINKYSKDVRDNLEALKKVVSGEKEDRITSFSDTDARFGKTSKEKEGGFCGYKVHISEDESEIVTSVDLLKGNENEGSHLKELLEKDESKGIKSDAVTADAKYDSGDNYQEIESRGMKPYLAFNPGSRRKWPGFKYRREQDAVECPCGKMSTGKVKQERGHLFCFSKKDCRPCPRIGECLKAGEDRARVFVRGEHIHSQEKPYLAAMLVRKMIERKFAEAKKWHKFSRTRYRGQWRVKIQALMTFFVINIKRIVRLFKKKRLRQAWEALSFT